jgi:hypothetical protein
MVTIGIAADGFSITINNKRYWINQEDDPSEKLSELFESLGYVVQIGEEY